MAPEELIVDLTERANGAPAPLEGLRWRRTYERTEVEQFFAQVEEERQRLQSEIDAAHDRLAQLRANEAAVAERQADVETALGALVHEAHAELDTIEREHREVVAAIEMAMTDEVARILAQAEEEATTIRAAAAVLAGRLNGEDTLPAWRSIRGSDDGR